MASGSNGLSSGPQNISNARYEDEKGADREGGVGKDQVLKGKGRCVALKECTKTKAGTAEQILKSNPSKANAGRRYRV